MFLIWKKNFLHFQDETFPELGVGSVEGCDDQDSVCSNNEREGDAFPKAFDRDLVTPISSQKSQADENQLNDDDTKDSITLNTTETETNKTNDNMTDDNSKLGKEFREMRTLEERRRSLLDHHWAVPSKERYYNISVCSPPSFPWPIRWEGSNIKRNRETKISHQFF